MFKKCRLWISKNAQALINVYLFINVMGIIIWQVYGLYKSGSLNFIEISFILHNAALAWVVLIRQRHIAIDRKLWHQGIAVIAFFSGIAFIGQPLSGSQTTVYISTALLITASVLGLISVIHLKDSFGILIACRSIKTNGLYRYVRHPMYATDILLRVGYLVSHCTIFTISIFFLSSACYVYRAKLEEEFLSKQSDDYLKYKKAVRYRFIPGLF